ITGRAITASHSAAGTVRKNTRRRVADSVVLSCGMSFATAARDRAGRLTVASATPKTPIGSCMILNAYHSHETLPCWSRLAICVLTSRLSWVAASPIVAGTMSAATRRTPGWPAGRSSRILKPSAASAGSWQANWSRPPSRTPIAMAIGVLLGGLLQFACQLPALAALGFKMRLERPAGHPGVRRVAALMVPATIGLAATQLNLLVSTQIASLLQQGSVSWLWYAFRIMQLPIGVFGVALATVSLPALSRAAVAKDMPQLKTTL